MPNSNIPYTRIQDIQIDDAELQGQFQELFKAGQWQQAISLLNDSQYQAQLDSKKYVAKIINEITGGIEYLESLYNDNVTVFLSNLAQQYNQLIAEFRRRGTFSPSTQYTPYNFVFYNDDVYMCLQQPPIGTLPTDTTYWLFLGLKGPEGAPGIDVSMKWEYSPETQYQANDLVVYNNVIYVALRDSINATPDASPDDWMVFITVTAGQINVGTLPPSAPVNDTVWFQTQVDPLTYTGSEPLIGVFKHYVEDYGIWEEMYPETIFEWVDDREDYAPVLMELSLTILTSDWANLTFSYNVPQITENSVITVLPESTMTQAQYKDYSKMFLSINGTNIVFNISGAATQNIPIRIYIIV